MNTLDDMLKTGRERIAALPDLRQPTKERIAGLKLEELRPLFELLCATDFHAVKLDEVFTSTNLFGFRQHDARYCRSIRDQILGVGEQAKPLTTNQLKALRVIMMREPYISQLALLAPI